MDQGMPLRQAEELVHKSGLKLSKAAIASYYEFVRRRRAELLSEGRA
jgi:hypothetical protein